MTRKTCTRLWCNLHSGSGTVDPSSRSCFLLFQNLICMQLGILNWSSFFLLLHPILLFSFPKSNFGAIRISTDQNFVSIFLSWRNPAQDCLQIKFMLSIFPNFCGNLPKPFLHLKCIWSCGRFFVDPSSDIDNSYFVGVSTFSKSKSKPEVGTFLIINWIAPALNIKYNPAFLELSWGQDKTCINLIGWQMNGLSIFYKPYACICLIHPKHQYH